MRSDRISPSEVGEDGDLSRSAVGSGDEPLPSRPDRRRGAAPGRARGPGHAGAPADPDHGQRRPAAPAYHAAAVRPALAAHLPGGDRWPLITSRGRSSPGRSCRGSRPASGRTGPTRSRLRSSRGPARRPNNLAPTPRHCHANATPLLARSYFPALAAFPQVDPPPGPGSPATTAGDPGPFGERKQRLRRWRPRHSAAAATGGTGRGRWISSIQPGCPTHPLGSVDGQNGGRR
jgi:hypothetical protein